MLSPALLADLARTLGGRHVRVTSSGKVQTTCLMAHWHHGGGRDEHPSMVLFPSGKKGDPIYSCQSCHQNGSVRELILLHWMFSGNNLIEWINLIDGESDGSAPKGIAHRVAKAAEKLTKHSWHRAPNEEHTRPIVLGPQAKLDVSAPLKTLDGKPYYDYQCLVEADNAKELPWSDYEPFAGSIPRYAIEERGLTPETCRVWELGHDKKKKRMMFPMRDRKQRLVCVSGRLYAKNCSYCGGRMVTVNPDPSTKKKKKLTRCASCGNMEPPKYLHTEGFKRNLILYGENRHKIDNLADGLVYVVEGHLDMLKLWQFGYRPVVAMLGSYPGPAQVEKLVALYGRRVVIVPDGDKAGDEMAERLSAKLEGRVDVVIKKLPRELDPGDLTIEQALEYIGEPTFKTALTIASD